jgi:hypothetical protein
LHSRPSLLAVPLAGLAAVPSRHFPPPLSVDELEACFVVRDSAGQKLAYAYYEEEPGRRSTAKLLTKDEARRIALNIAKLPQHLRGGQLKQLAPEQRAEPERGGVENWLAEKALLAALAAAGVIVGAISIWLAK